MHHCCSSWTFSFVTSDTMASELNLPFISHDPKIGDPPSLSWASFETPKLRRFPYPTQFEFLEWLGSGLDGIVVKVTAEEYPDPFVLKFVSYRRHLYIRLLVMGITLTRDLVFQQ